MEEALEGLGNLMVRLDSNCFNYAVRFIPQDFPEKLTPLKDRFYLPLLASIQSFFEPNLWSTPNLSSLVWNFRIHRFFSPHFHDAARAFLLVKLRADNWASLSGQFSNCSEEEALSLASLASLPKDLFVEILTFCPTQWFCTRQSIHRGLGRLSRRARSSRSPYSMCSNH